LLAGPNGRAVLRRSFGGDPGGLRGHFRAAMAQASCLVLSPRVISQARVDAASRPEA
jgi:hypothetical protein